MSIWFTSYSLEEINRRGNHTMVEYLGITFTEFDDRSLTATMPVDHRTKQPAGRLHGGASAALAETLGSTAANLCVDPQHYLCVGLDININHVRGVKQGTVIGVTTPIHLGRSTQVWEINITHENHLIAISRLTMAVLKNS